ncbi:MAG: GNAT family N-acetyltransferase [Hamadaea sp.]|nr:GNAT family N-acetyltransferase [Hamadaea sp.]
MALWRVRATVDDRPGYLAVLAASLALRSVNILAVQVHTTEAGAVDDFLIDAPEQLTERDLLAAVEKGRGRDAWIRPADAHGLVDPPTQALGLAARVVASPEALGETLAALFDCDVTWRPEHQAQRYAADRLTVADPSGGTLVLARRTPVFTPAEFARAQALAEIAGQAAAAQLARMALLLPDGVELTVRPALPSDLDAVADMHARCSPASLYRRYLAGTRGPSAAQLTRLLEPRRGGTLVATDAQGRIIAFANLVGEGEIAEAAVLVEDSWQRRGIGTALLRRLVSLARPADFAAVLLHTHAENTAMLRTVRRLGDDGALPIDPAYDRDGAIVTVTLALGQRFAVA